MKNNIKWNESNLNIRCWGCGTILINLSTNGNFIKISSLTDEIEIGCPNCHSSCGYKLHTGEDNIFISHNWEPDVDRREFNGSTGESNRNLFKEYKIILSKLSNSEKIYKKEFELVGDYLEYISENDQQAIPKNQDLIEEYVEVYKYDFPSKNSKETFKKAINRFYKLLELK